MSDTPLPTIAAAVGAVLQRIAAGERALFIALAEHLAAERYRGWAAGAEGPARSGLLACAAREDDIADRVAALYPNAATRQAELRAEHPELEALNESLFADRPLAEQFAIQAAGERAGAALWRSFAERADDPARTTFLACAALEEASADYLDTLLATRR